MTTKVTEGLDSPESLVDRVAAFKRAAAKSNALLRQAGFTEKDLEEVVRDFKSWRKQSTK
jgi:hypothetical protein